MELWINSEQCTGCAACANACPKDAISFQNDEKGNFIPVIDKEKCVNCGLCRKVCAVDKCITKEKFSAKPKKEEPDIYAAWSRTYATRYNSTSGGAFSEFAKTVLSDGGYIAGAVYDENQMVHHIVSNDEKDLERIRQSKYTQSEIRMVYREIRALLKNGETVLFCGAPCQVAALYEYLGGDNENLITVDFICRGVNSPMAYRAWLDDLEEEYGGKATRVWFKNKELGWNKFSTRVDFANGRTYRKSRYEDLYMRGYLERNLFIRPSCTDCNFKGMPRFGDITLADFWKIDKELDADLGTSMVVINSEKGDALFKRTKGKLVAHKRTYEEALKGNACLVTSAKKGKSSDDFYKLLNEGKSYSQAFRMATGEMHPLISAIVVVDKRMACLEESVLSICNQEYENLEVLMVCASAEAGLRMRVKELAELDSRIKLLEPVEDVASAQNVALINARGEYVHFTTGAEVLYDGLYAGMIEQMIENKCGVACFGWADSRNVSMCRSAFNGTGNKRAFMELIMTEPSEISGFSGYGYQLWNKIFRRDLLFVDDMPIEVSPQGYGLSELFWLVKISLCVNKVFFTSEEMLRHKIGALEYKASPSIVISEFFDRVTETLQLLEGIEEYAYDALLRTCFKYEMDLLVSAKNYPLPKMTEKLVEHMAYFLQVPLDEKEIVDIYSQVWDLKKDRKFLKGKVTGLEKDREFLKKKSSRFENRAIGLSKDVEFLKKKSGRLQDKVAGLEKDKEFLKKKSGRFEKKNMQLENKVAGLGKDVEFLKKKSGRFENKIASLEKDKEFLKNKSARLDRELTDYKSSVLVRVSYKFHRLYCKIKNKLKR